MKRLTPLLTICAALLAFVLVPMQGSVLAEVPVQGSVLAGVEDEFFPPGYFDCLPEQIADMTVIQSRGSSGRTWEVPFNSESNDGLSWRAFDYTAVGVESGLTYTIRERRVSLWAYDLPVDADAPPFPSDLDAGGSIMRFQHPGGPAPNRRWVIEHFHVDVYDSQIEPLDTIGHACGQAMAGE